MKSRYLHISARGDGLQRVDEFIFYDLSVKLHRLTELEQVETIYSDLMWILSAARDSLDAIYKSRPLLFSAPAAGKLYNHITSIIPLDMNDMIGEMSNENGENTKVSWWEIAQLKQFSSDFETALKTECAVMDAYYVVKKGAYSTKDLVENAHFQIPLPSRSLVPQITRDDFDQAGKCLAFDVYTAAAFHLLRGTEAVVREYYELVVPGPKQASLKMRNWGTYVRLLRNNGGKDSVIYIVDHLRDAYRNPVLHPSDFYDEERVVALFGLCVSAIILLQSEIKLLRNSSGTLQCPAAV